MRITEEAALALVKAFYPRKTKGKWYITDNGDGYWEVTYHLHGRRRPEVNIFVSPAGATETVNGNLLWGSQ